jgi:hypothetical protein
MFELIGLLVAAGAAGAGYIKSRSFVAERLRYVDAVQKPSAPFIAGAAATAVAAPVVMLVPVIGAGTAVLFGVAVGAGTRAGVRNIRRTFRPGRA